MVNFNLTNISFHGIITISMKGDIFYVKRNWLKFVDKFCKEHNVTLDNYKEYIKFVEYSQWLLKNGYIEFKESKNKWNN
mgnify:CR=1 FL=1